jgi:uncharacterized membrane protein
MNKKMGIILVILGIAIAGLLILAKVKEEMYINLIVERNGGSCILEDGTCLHDAHNLWPYILGGLISFSSIFGGIYFLLKSGLNKEVPLKPEQDTSSQPSRKEHLLSDDEKKVLDEVKKEGNIFQSAIAEKAGDS